MEDHIKNELIAIKRIKSYILNAQEEVLISSAWFINDEILNVLVEVCCSGIKVKLIVDSNHWKKKIEQIVLPQKFEVLKNVNKPIFKKRYRYVFDRELIIYSKEPVIIGRRYNPFDNIVISEDFNLLNRSLKLFNKNSFSNSSSEKISIRQKMFSRLKKSFKKQEAVDSEQELELSNIEVPKTGLLQTKITSIDSILDALVSTSIEDFDKESVKALGLAYASNVRGNSNSLMKMMDTIYAEFVYSINNHLRQKAELITKIDLTVEDFNKKISDEFERENEMREKESIAKKEECLIEINKCERDIEKIEFSLSEIEIVIPEKKEEIKEVENKKHNLNIENIPVEETNILVNNASMISYIFIIIALLCCVVLFYASASYILIYGSQDLIQNSANIDSMTSLIDLNFFDKVYVKGGWGLFYVFVFTVIPIGLMQFISSIEKKMKKTLFHSILILLDLLLAYKISSNVNEIKKLNGDDNINYIFTLDKLPEMLIIFFLGYFPLFILIKFIKKLRETYKKGKYDKRIEIFKKEENQINNEIINLSHQLSEFENKRHELKRNLANLNGLIKELEIQLVYISVKAKAHENALKKELDNRLLDIRSKARIYKNGINNNNISLPVLVFKDRINTFLEGWKMWLYQQFAEKVAGDLLLEADSVVDTWIKNNIDTSDNNTIKKINVKSEIF